MVYMYLFPSMPEEAEGGDYISPDRGSVVCDSTAVYRPRNAEESILYRIVAENLETFLSRQWERDRPVPRFVERELRLFLNCGIPALGFPARSLRYLRGGPDCPIFVQRARVL